VGRFISEDPISFGGGDINLFRYVGNNSTNFTDPTGFLVGGVFDRKTGVLILKDLDGKSPPIGINVFSGEYDAKNNPSLEYLSGQGPIPAGTYEILENAKPSDWYRLDRIDSNPRNDRDDDRYKRGQFRLHPGSRSEGCITIPKEEQDDWKAVQEMLKNTNTLEVNDNYQDRGRFSFIRNFLGNKKIKKYGVIIVK
jgi:uncharacterized protein RhaS with RHS repeats